MRRLLAVVSARDGVERPLELGPERGTEGHLEGFRCLPACHFSSLVALRLPRMRIGVIVGMLYHRSDRLWDYVITMPSVSGRRAMPVTKCLRIGRCAVFRDLGDESNIMSNDQLLSSACCFTSSGWVEKERRRTSWSATHTSSSMTMAAFAAAEYSGAVLTLVQCQLAKEESGASCSR